MEHAVNNQHLHPIFRDILNSFAMASELQAMADEIKARHESTRTKEPVLRTTSAGVYRRYISTAYPTCSLCGDASEGQVCARCDVYMERGGTL